MKCRIAVSHTSVVSPVAFWDGFHGGNMDRKPFLSFWSYLISLINRMFSKAFWFLNPEITF